MAKRKGDSLDSESEEALKRWSSEEGDETPASNNGKKQESGVSEYEKQRLARIAENRARMEALGLPKMASSLMGSAQNSRKSKGKAKGSAQNSRKSKGKAKVTEEDEDYRPQEEEPVSSSSEEEENNDDEDYLGKKTSSGSNKREVKSKVSKSNKKVPVGKMSNKKVPVRKILSKEVYMDEDDALKLAIALSLQDSGEASQRSSGKKGKKQTQEDSRRNKGKKSFASRLQMTEDELLVHFYQFDENWKGGISVKDLERVATAHDFTWTDHELADMIRCFDSDGDGKLSLDDFRNIAVRCRLIKESEDDA